MFGSVWLHRGCHSILGFAGITGGQLQTNAHQFFNTMYTCKPRRVGNPDSKYAYDYDGSKFQADIEASKAKAEKLYADFRQWMIDRNVTPDEIRPLFLKFIEEFY